MTFFIQHEYLYFSFVMFTFETLFVVFLGSAVQGIDSLVDTIIEGGIKGWKLVQYLEIEGGLFVLKHTGTRNVSHVWINI